MSITAIRVKKINPIKYINYSGTNVYTHNNPITLILYTYMQLRKNGERSITIHINDVDYKRQAGGYQKLNKRNEILKNENSKTEPSTRLLH
ncbi:hypothetical protein GCM10008924_14130 [Gracilibacillus halotolerans]